jgi:hypothetical protein
MLSLALARWGGAEMPEYRAVTTLIPRIALATLMILLAGTFATHNNATGQVNKLLYLCILAVAFALTVIFRHEHRSARIDTVVAVLAACGLVWGIWTIERPQLLQYGYWEGFGYHVAIAAMALLLLFGIALQPQRFPTPLRLGIGLLVGLCCICDALGAIRTVDFMPFVNNNLNEINDLLGPAAGKVPESTYIPQYTTLYGWLFWPFKSVLSPVALVGAISIFFTIAGVATVLLAVLIVKRVVGVRGYLLAVTLVVPITYVTSHQLGATSSIASLFQEVPIRLLSGLLILLIGLTDLVLLYRGTVRSVRLVLIGVGCGVITWNSQDFGLAATLVYGVIILFGAMSSVRIRAIGAWLTGVIIGIASYPLFLLSIGSPLNLGFVGVYIRLFGSGFGSAPMQVPGPVLVVMPIIVGSAATGWALMRSRRPREVAKSALLDQATIALTFVGTWSVVCLVYYVNRAYAEGQLQTMLLPCAICIGALLSIAIHSPDLRAVWEQKRVMTRAQLSEKIKLIPLGLFACLCFASTLLTPDPFVAARSLLNPPPMSGFVGYDLPAVTSAIRSAQEYTSHKPGDLTYLGESFNYISLATHVPSITLLFPFPPYGASAVIQIECRYLEDHHSRWLVLSPYGLSTFGNDACGLYRSVTLHGVPYGQFQELK